MCAALPAASYSQCTPDRNACTPLESGLPGCLSPAIADTAYVGRPYEETVQLNFLRVAPAPPNPLGVSEVYISRLVLLEVRQLPAGITVLLNSGNPVDEVNGKDKGTFTAPNTDTPIFGCAQFRGTATEANTGVDSVEFVFEVFIKLVVNGNVTGNEINPNDLGAAFNPVVYRYRMPAGEPTARKNSATPFAEFQVYPNPSSGYFRLTLPETATKGMQIQILDAQGRLVKSLEAIAGQTEQPVDAASLPSGLYLIRLTDATGNTLGSKQVLRD